MDESGLTDKWSDVTTGGASRVCRTVRVAVCTLCGTVCICPHAPPRDVTGSSHVAFTSYDCPHPVGSGRGPSTVSTPSTGAPRQQRNEDATRTQVRRAADERRHVHAVPPSSLFDVAAHTAPLARNARPFACRPHSIHRSCRESRPPHAQSRCRCGSGEPASPGADVACDSEATHIPTNRTQELRALAVAAPGNFAGQTTS